MNDKSDAFLDENGFSREEINLGIKQVMDKFDLGSMARIFLSDL